MKHRKELEVGDRIVRSYVINLGVIMSDVRNTLVYTLTYGVEASSDEEAEKQAEDIIFSEVGSGIEFEILDTNTSGDREYRTLQIDVRVPDTVDETYFPEAETIDTAEYVPEEENFNTPEPRSIEAYRGKITWRDNKQMEVLTDAGELKETRITAGETKLVTKAGDNDE